MKLSQIIFWGVLCSITYQVANASNCQDSVDSVRGIALTDHVMDSFSGDSLESCYKRCATKPGCKSINFYLSSFLCELNSKTVGDAPGKKVNNQDAIYFVNLNPVKSTRCSTGWASYNGSCYFFKHRAGRVTWNNARQRCSDMGGWLVDIRTQDELKFIRSQRNPLVEQYHIGVKELNRTNVWIYLDGSIMSLANIWSPGEPNDFEGREDCVSIDFRKYEGKFNDIPCGVAYDFNGLPDSFICKAKPSDV